MRFSEKSSMFLYYKYFLIYRPKRKENHVVFYPFFASFFVNETRKYQITEKHIHQLGLKYTHFFVLVYGNNLHLPNLATFELKKCYRSKKTASIYFRNSFVKQKKQKKTRDILYVLICKSNIYRRKHKENCNRRVLHFLRFSAFSPSNYL